MGFVQEYGRCARLSYRDGRNRFALVPKLHMVHHAGFRLVMEAGLSDWVVSPLARSVQLEEDFIGKPSRLSRRVNAGRLVHVRLLERSLICSMYAVEASDHDDRGF